MNRAAVPLIRWFWHHSHRVKAALDLACWLAAIPVAFWLRLEAGPSVWGYDAFALGLTAVPLVLFCIYEFRLAAHSWGHTSLEDGLRLGLATAFCTMATTALSFVLRSVLPVAIPLTVPLVAGAVAGFLMACLRLGTRWVAEHRGFRGAHAQVVLIVGTGEPALQLARNVGRSLERVRVAGFLDDNPSHAGMSFLGIRVLGRTEEAERLINQVGATDVLVALPDANGAATRRLQATCDRMGVRCRYLTDMGQLLRGRLQTREGDAWGLEEMLRRDAVRLDVGGISSMLAGKIVLITGAGGSIGSEIARQVAGYRPASLVLVGIEENGIFDLAQSLRLDHAGLDVQECVADVRSDASVTALFGKHRPAVVFHAAAHKHVPLMEAQPCEAILNNVGGTRVVLDHAVASGVQRFVLISTDKAVRPGNVMGATKRVAEMLLEDAARRAPGRDFVAVRFGNVLGSRGSVIPTWERQIARGGPLTVTHPEMTRYFMLIPEAVQLVLQAALYGGPGRIYVLDMGTPVRILDFAENFIRQHGLLPGKDIAIQVVGLRPGEKMHEELFVGLHQTASPHPKILVDQDASHPKDFAAKIASLLEDARAQKDREVRVALALLTEGQMVESAALARSG